MRRLAAHLLLALAVGLLAPGGYVHALSHLDAPVNGQKGDDAGTNPGAACELCAAYAVGDGGAAPPVVAPLLILPATTSVATPAEPSLPSLALTRFASRAPPFAL